MTSSAVQSDLLNQFRTLPYSAPGLQYTRMNAQIDRDGKSVPSNAARILFSDGIVTNGARIWRDDILIQGPETDLHFQTMGRLIVNQGIKVIVKIGKPGEDYKKDYQKVQGEDVTIIPVPEWTSGSTIATQRLFDLVEKVDKTKSKAMIHCSYSAGRASVFVACLQAYRVFKEGKSINSEYALQLVKELREMQYAAIGEPTHFQTLVDFIKLLNEKK